MFIILVMMRSRIRIGIGYDVWRFWVGMGIQFGMDGVWIWDLGLWNAHLLLRIKDSGIGLGIEIGD